MHDSCAGEWDAHWKCLEQNNQVGVSSYMRIDFAGVQGLPETGALAQLVRV